MVEFQVHTPWNVVNTCEGKPEAALKCVAQGRVQPPPPPPLADPSTRAGHKSLEAGLGWPQV